MGHFHNRGRVIECLAKYFGDEAVFIHIRRNRYDIARSFIDRRSIQTPCKVDYKIYGEHGWEITPGVATW